MVDLKTKKYSNCLVLILLILTLIPILNVKAITIVTDSVDDVWYYQDDVFQEIGDYQNEIDIVSIEVDGLNLIMTLQDQPLNDDDHEYRFVVRWATGSYRNNVTSAVLARERNEVSTILLDSQDQIIVDTTETDSITIIDETLVVEIPEYDLIENSNNPELFSGDTSAYAGALVSYVDVIQGIPSSLTPGYTIFIAISSLTISVLVILIIGKKK